MGSVGEQIPRAVAYDVGSPRGRQPASRAESGRLRYNVPMTKKEVKEIPDRVLTWSEERQESAARVLADIEIEEYDATEHRRMDEQVAEVK
jgi:hypothetical protein